jgi:subtilisin-like proprotein convertase family protein
MPFQSAEKKKQVLRLATLAQDDNPKERRHSRAVDRWSYPTHSTKARNGWGTWRLKETKGNRRSFGSLGSLRMTILKRENIKEQ